MDKPLIHFDKRIAERSIRKGELEQEEFDNFINTLPDRAGDSEPLDLEEEAKIGAPAPGPAADAEAAPDVPQDVPQDEAPPGPAVDAIAAPPVETDISEALASPAEEDEASGAAGDAIDTPPKSD